VVLNRGRHLYSAGWPSRWALAHILVSSSYGRPCIADADIIFLCCFFLLFFLILSQQSQIGCLPYFHTWCDPSANLECRSEMWCTRLAENAGRKKSPKIRDLRTIAQLCQAISLQIRHVSTIGKKLVKQQYVLHMSLQYGELWTMNGWDLFGSLGHPSKFQRVSRLGTFAALNTGCHLYSAGRPSRCALAHILVVILWLLNVLWLGLLLQTLTTTAFVSDKSPL